MFCDGHKSAVIVEKYRKFPFFLLMVKFPYDRRRQRKLSRRGGRCEDMDVERGHGVDKDIRAKLMWHGLVGCNTAYHLRHRER